MRMRQGNMPLPPDWVDSLGGRLIHNDVHLLPRFISDAELDPILSTYAIGLHNRLCRESLEQFFRQNLDYIPKDGSTGPTSEQRCVLYTRVNLIAHWVNLGYVGIEDVRDRILQSLVNHPAVHIHQLHSLMILLKLSGATFAAYVDPSVMDRCRLFLGLSHLISAGLAEVRTLILAIKGDYEFLDYSTFYNFGKAVGKVFLLLQSSTAQSQLLFPSLRIPRSLQLQHPWDSQGRGNSLSHLPYPHPLQRFPQMRSRTLQLPHLHQPVSPPCPTSPYRITSTMSRPLNPKLSRIMTCSTSLTAALKFYVARPSFVSTLARCHSTLLCSVKCFHRRISPPSSLPTGARASCPPIHQLISRLS